MANAQTIATKKYHEKIGLVSKSFNLKKTDVEDFKEACRTAGISQSAQITKMMRQRIILEDNLFIRLKAYADRLGLDTNNVVGEAVTEYLDKAEQ